MWNNNRVSSHEMFLTGMINKIFEFFYNKHFVYKLESFIEIKPSVFAYEQCFKAFIFSTLQHLKRTMRSKSSDSISILHGSHFISCCLQNQSYVVNEMYRLKTTDIDPLREYNTL